MCECLSNFNIEISRKVFAKFSSSKHVLSIILMATWKKGEEKKVKSVFGVTNKEKLTSNQRLTIDADWHSFGSFA